MMDQDWPTFLSAQPGTCERARFGFLVWGTYPLFQVGEPSAFTIPLVKEGLTRSVFYFGALWDFVLFSPLWGMVSKGHQRKTANVSFACIETHPLLIHLC